MCACVCIIIRMGLGQNTIVVVVVAAVLVDLYSASRSASNAIIVSLRCEKVEFSEPI